MGVYVLVQLLLSGKLLSVTTGFGNVCSFVSHIPFFHSGDYKAVNNWLLWFIIGIPLGGLLAAATSGGHIVASFSIGFILSRAGATTYDFYAKLFLFRNFQLFWVILFAAATGFVGIKIMQILKVKTLIGREPIDYQKKPYKTTLIPGSLLFGLGWGLAGACPGTALAMLGEGKLGVLFTILGMFLGTYFYGLQMSRGK